MWGASCRCRRVRSKWNGLRSVGERRRHRGRCRRRSSRGDRRRAPRRGGSPPARPPPRRAARGPRPTGAARSCRRATATSRGGCGTCVSWAATRTTGASRWLTQTGSDGSTAGSHRVISAAWSAPVPASGGWMLTPTTSRPAARAASTRAGGAAEALHARCQLDDDTAVPSRERGEVGVVADR